MVKVPNLPVEQRLGRSGASRASLRSRRRNSDRTLRQLVGELIAARVRAGLTQEQVAIRMGTTKSAISRLESGLFNRPRLTTIENCALVVRCQVNIRLQPLP
jgi:DNA-binding XRE family transcriptional regulator